MPASEQKTAEPRIFRRKFFIQVEVGAYKKLANASQQSANVQSEKDRRYDTRSYNQKSDILSISAWDRQISDWDSGNW